MVRNIFVRNADSIGVVYELLMRGSFRAPFENTVTATPMHPYVNTAALIMVLEALDRIKAYLWQCTEKKSQIRFDTVFTLQYAARLPMVRIRKRRVLKLSFDQKRS